MSEPRPQKRYTVFCRKIEEEGAIELQPIAADGVAADAVGQEALDIAVSILEDGEGEIGFDEDDTGFIRRQMRVEVYEGNHAEPPAGVAPNWVFDGSAIDRHPRT